MAAWKIVMGNGVEKKRSTRASIKDKSQGHFAQKYDALRQNPDEFYGLTLMYPDDFDHLLDLLGARIVTLSSNICMGPKERLFLTLQ